MVYYFIPNIKKYNKLSIKSKSYTELIWFQIGYKG